MTSTVRHEDPVVSGDPWAGLSLAVEETAGRESKETPTREAAAARTAGGLLDRIADALDAMRRPFTPVQAAAWAVLIVVAGAAIYWLVQRHLPRWTSSNPNLNFYVAQPLLWGGLALIAVVGWRHLPRRPMARPSLLGVAALVGLFHVAILVFGGFVFGFGDSPTAGRVANYPKNLLYLVTLLAGIEASRAFLLAAWNRRHRTPAFLLVTGLCFVITMSYGQLRLVTGGDWTLDLVAGRLIPALALSGLLTWLVAVGGMGPSFGYVFAIYALDWFSPVYPANPWWVLLIVGVVMPMLAIPVIRSVYDTTAEQEAIGPLNAQTGARIGDDVRRPADEADTADGEDEAPTDPVTVATRWGWTGLTAGTVVLIVIVFGVMGVRPFLVDGISMQPAYESGDIALVRSVDPADLEVGDVIKFSTGSLSVIHRIVTIEQRPEGMMIVTQGDNVNRADPPISPDQVEGKVVFLLPEIGKIAFWLDGIF